MIRFTAIILFLLLFSIVSLPMYLVVYIIGRINPKKKVTFAQDFVVKGFRIVLKLSGTVLNVEGQELVPEGTPVLYVANHRSYYDIVTCYTLVKNNTGFIAKKEMLKIPLLSRWMKFLHCLFLDRSDIKEGLKTILAAIEKVKSGISIAIFPEGTRSTSASELDMLPFHEGSFKIATKTGCPIIPVSISHSSAIFEDHMPFVKATHVVIEYGKPIYPKELSREDQKFLGKRVQETILETLKRNASAV